MSLPANPVHSVNQLSPALVPPALQEFLSSGSSTLVFFLLKNSKKKYKCEGTPYLLPFVVGMYASGGKH